MIKGFKDFITRGSVVDLAVGVVIGAAFTTVVTSFSNSFLLPLIKAMGAGDGNIGGELSLPGEGNAITWGAFLSSVFAFMMTAAVVYFLVVLPMNRLAQMRKRGEEPEQEAPSEEVLILREIRDELIAQRDGTNEPVRQRTGK